MAKKAVNLCQTCKKYNGQTLFCDEKALEEIIIINRRETKKPYFPIEQTECKYYEVKE